MKQNTPEYDVFEGLNNRHILAIENLISGCNVSQAAERAGVRVAVCRCAAVGADCLHRVVEVAAADVVDREHTRDCGSLSEVELRQ